MRRGEYLGTRRINRSTRSAALIATAVTVPVAVGVALVGVLVLGSGSSAQDAGPVASTTTTGTPGPLMTTVPGPDATTAATCAPLLAKMPVQLDAGDGSTLAPLRVEPGGPTFLAWGNPQVTLHCGVGRPDQLRSDNPEFHPFVLAKSGDDPNAVAWAVDEDEDKGTSTWTTVDRSVYVRVVAPSADYVLDLSEIIGAQLPAVCQATTEDTGGPDGNGVLADCGDRP